MEDVRYVQRTYTSQRPSKCSVVLNNVIKIHNKKTVLNGVNLTAYSGQICAIFGDMQSGKSALLSCLVGGDTVDKGQIWVLGGRPKTKSSSTLTNRVGYMPQENCLYNTMTILELFMYFGHLYNIHHEFTQWRIRYYNDMFKLPQTNIAIEHLSFSQKRIVSFLISVFHRPRLLVLDEPTVGLDFLKQHRVWKYLNHSCITWKPTVIVATNNIEEAFLATKIAYLNNGKIMFKKKVVELQQLIPNNEIETIIEDLCNNSMSDLDENAATNAAISRYKKLSLRKQIMPRSNIWKLQALTFQRIKYLAKNIWMIILFCIIPGLQVLLHCMYYGKYPHAFPIAIYNKETDCVKITCERIEHCTHYSCHLMNVLTTSKIKAEYYSSEFSAKDSVVKRLTMGYMRVPANYTNTIIKIMEEKIVIKEPDFTISGIYIEIDMTTFEYQEHFKKHLFDSHKLHLMDIYSFYNLSKKYANIPIKVYESANLNPPENTISGIISCAIFSSAMFYSALSIQNEIQNGYMMRNIIAGVTIYEILLSFLITHSIFAILQTFSFFFMAELLLNISWYGSFLLIVQLNIGIGICGMSIGLLIGIFADSEVRTFLTILIVYFENIIITGLFWPLENLTPVLWLLAILSPLCVPLKTVEAVLIQGRYKEITIIYAVICVILWTIITFIAFIIKFKNKINFII